MRAAQIVWAALAPHSTSPKMPADYMMFPEDALAIPEDVDGRERDWMLQLSRTAG